jgi:zinc/manganese transport system substrate-binding protein
MNATHNLLGTKRTAPATVAWKAMLAVVGFGALLTGCGTGSSSSPVMNESAVNGATPRIVVTNAILGSLVGDLVGDGSAVTVLVPNGKDPHDYEPSAKDVAALMNADLIVRTGLGYEETLDKTIDKARGEGVQVFTVSDYVSVKSSDGEMLGVVHDSKEEKDHDEEDHDEKDHDDHAHSDGDPHFLSDPITLREMVRPLGKMIEFITKIDTSESISTVLEQLSDADELVNTVMSQLGATPCRLVTGHNSMRYFADRYNCEVIGAIVASSSSTAEATAGALSQLKSDAKAAGVRAIFIDEGTSQSVANQISSEIGAQVYELASHTIPSDGLYSSYVVKIAETIVQGLAVK